jgi:hypothetical protein
MNRLVMLVMLVGCEREHEYAGPKPQCSVDSECPQIDGRSSCAYACFGSTCALRVESSKVGARPCFGDKRGAVASIGGFHDDKVVVVCDVNNGVYCDTTHRCAAAKPIGSACRGDNECGDDGGCVAGRCAQATVIGGSCAHARCGNRGFCDDHDVCEARADLGQPCDVSDHCQSLECVAGTCRAAQPPIACPVVLPTW